eukprot:2190200-Pyramimonas_sp.AAC.1
MVNVHPIRYLENWRNPQWTEPYARCVNVRPRCRVSCGVLKRASVQMRNGRVLRKGTCGNLAAPVATPDAFLEAKLSVPLVCKSARNYGPWCQNGGKYYHPSEHKPVNCADCSCPSGWTGTDCSRTSNCTRCSASLFQELGLPAVFIAILMWLDLRKSNRLASELG